MVGFYDPRNEADLSRVENLLHQGGVEYVLAETPRNSGISLEIEVAEEDVPRAEELLQQANR